MFLLEKKHPIETDIIIDILKSERIPYKLRSIKQECFFMPTITLGYDIEIYSDLEHFDYAKRLINKRMANIGMLEIAYEKPAVDKMGNPIVSYPMYNKEVYFCQNFIQKQKTPKKTLLKRLIDWIIKKSN